jgi:hypothetical protein
MLTRLVLLCAILLPSHSLAQSSIPPTAWRVVSAASEAPGYPARAAFDGNPQTFWHTAWAAGSKGHPHALTLDLGKVHLVNGFRYLPRQDQAYREIGRIATYAFAVSLDGQTWSEDVEGTFANLPEAQTVSIAATPARYVRLTAMSEYVGLPYTTIAELSIFEPHASMVVTATSRLAWDHDGEAGAVGFRLWVDGKLTAIPRLRRSGTSYTTTLPTMTAGEHVLELAAYDESEQSERVVLRVVVALDATASQ